MGLYRINPKYTGKKRFWQRFDKRLNETRAADRDAQQEHVTIKQDTEEKHSKIGDIIKGIFDVIAMWIIVN